MSQTPLRIVIVGHVDHGKSTLVGRLFHDTNSLPEGKLEQIQATCKRRGVPFEWAFLMDALQAERDQNITIDTSQIWFHTDKRNYVIIDAPGHREFLKNMITGAASASAALLLIAADEGVREQSRRHGYMLSLLGIKDVVVVVNKMDLVDYDQGVFDEIETEYREFLGQIGVEPRAFVPISAREGDNIASRSEHTAWFEGNTVVESLDAFDAPVPRTDAPLRMPIQDIYRFDERRILAGRIDSGRLRVGDELVFFPGGKRAEISSIEQWSAPTMTSAAAGDSIGVTLTEQIFVERGQVAVHAGDIPMVTDRFHANVFWMGKRPLVTGRRYKLKLGAQEVGCVIESFEALLDTSTLEPIEGVNELPKDDVAQVILKTARPIAIDLYQELHTQGRFVIVDEYDVAGGGIITETQDIVDHAVSSDASPVTSGERFARQTQRGAVVWLMGEPEVRASLATGLDRALFDRDLRSYVLDPGPFPTPAGLDAAAWNLASAGLVTIVAATELGEPAKLATTLEDLGAPFKTFPVDEETTVEGLLDDLLPALRMLRR